LKFNKTNRKKAKDRETGKTVILLFFFAYPGVLRGFEKSSHRENPGLVISDKNQALNLTNLF
jgi:hypothetical protein